VDGLFLSRTTRREEKKKQQKTKGWVPRLNKEMGNLIEENKTNGEVWTVGARKKEREKKKKWINNKQKGEWPDKEPINNK
jgi:hypothetical protein